MSMSNGSHRRAAAGQNRTVIRWSVLAVALLSSSTACTPHPVGPARTFSAYEGKAVTTAESALSRVETVRLAAQTGDDGNAFGSYLSVLISAQEDSLGATQGTFASIQPPDAAADALRDELGALIDTALDHVATVRIAVRRGQLDGLAAVAAPLADDARSLRAFTDGHR
jgi:hypothetical protein